MTAVYVTDLPPLFNWVHSILAALIVLTVLQNCCLPFVHKLFVFSGVGLIHTLCPGEYYECAILFDRPYLGVSSMHFDIRLPGIYVTQFLLRGSPFGFQQSSVIPHHYVCVA